MNIHKLAKEIHNNNVIKGFWDKPRNEGEVLFLIITELSEMCESDRKSRNGSIKKFESGIKKIKNESTKINSFEINVKDCVGDEIADAFIRMCDYCVGFKVEIDEAGIKREVNRSKGLKLKNLGEELLNISGMIKFLHKGIIKKMSVTMIFAKMMWLSRQLNIPLEKHIKWKMWYNETRPKMHNKKY